MLLRSEAEILAASDDPERTYVEILLPLKAKAYAHYVNTQSFKGDLRIIMRTFRQVMAPTPVAQSRKDLDL